MKSVIRAQVCGGRRSGRVTVVPQSKPTSATETQAAIVQVLGVHQASQSVMGQVLTEIREMKELQRGHKPGGCQHTHRGGQHQHQHGNPVWGAAGHQHHSLQGFSTCIFLFLCSKNIQAVSICCSHRKGGPVGGGHTCTCPCLSSWGYPPLIRGDVHPKIQDTHHRQEETLP